MKKQDHVCENENDYMVQDYEGKWYLDDEYDIHVPINFCPFCGENLGVLNSRKAIAGKLNKLTDTLAEKYGIDQTVEITEEMVREAIAMSPVANLLAYPYHDCKGTPGYPCEVCGKELPKLRVA